MYTLQSVEARAIYPPVKLNGEPVFTKTGKPKRCRVSWQVATLQHSYGGQTVISCRKRKGQWLYHVVSPGWPHGRSFSQNAFWLWARVKFGMGLAQSLVAQLQNASS